MCCGRDILMPSRVQMCHFELGTRGQGDKGELKLLVTYMNATSWYEILSSSDDFLLLRLCKSG